MDFSLLVSLSVDYLVLDRRQLTKIEAMSFCVRVLSFITPLHCITQTEEPKLLKAELFLDRLEEITDQASDGIQKAKL